ncbi:MAG: thiolase family protein [Syntrophomonadaceae bacterium]
MRKVVVAGVGMHPCGTWKDKETSEIALTAILNALDDSGVPFKDIDAVYCSHVAPAASLAEVICEKIGLTGVPMLNVENACASGSTAIREAWLAVANGVYDIALVIGVEKISGIGVLGGAGDKGNLDMLLGMNIMPSLYALMANEHMHKYGTTKEQLALVGVKNKRNGVLNPYAHIRKEFTIEQVLGSRMICDPITLLMCCPNSDGAAAAVICAENLVRRYNSKPKVFCAGSALKTMVYGMPPEDLTIRTGKAAYEMAGVSPKDIDVAEVHDAFTIGEILHYEALGFCPEGEGGRFLEEGHTQITGDIAVNPSGGLQSRGHPLGMTGVAQVSEIVWQLRQEAKGRQVNNPKVGLTHTQGAGGVCSVNIFTL